MDFEKCKIPASAHILIDVDGRLSSTCEYSEISAKSLADLLVQGFGVDVDELFDGHNRDPAA